MQMGLADSNSPMMEEFVYFHDFANLLMLMIMGFVFSMACNLIMNNSISSSFKDGQFIETMWTIIPALILINLALPSLGLIYLMDEIPNPGLTIKSVGHQWYWEYEYSDMWLTGDSRTLQFDSYMVQEDSIKEGWFRQLEVDNRVTIPYEISIRMLVTSADVIHSWSLPNLGVKADAIPGRLNQIHMISLYPSILYGQCSEICGVGHSHMPIVVESVNNHTFLNWYINTINSNL